MQTAVKNREAKGNSASHGAFPGGGAQRALSGLPVRRQLETRSPVSAAPPGRSSANASAPAHFPEAALNAPCPGYQSADGWKPVARSAQRHRDEAAPMPQSRHISRRRRSTRLVRATSPQT
uniref:hypothetical protein n=1 Tax=Klebsiella sp. TaxID=576 RepID=UPI00258C2656